MQQTSSTAEFVEQKNAADIQYEQIYPSQLKTEEESLIEERRRNLNLDKSHLKVGIALSGGGIRSATFSLGLFQAIARSHFLNRIDYLSTVSGGGYFGSFFGKLFLPLTPNDTPANALQRAHDAISDNQSPPVNWLRENGRYIAPTGNGDYFFAACTYLRNWTGIQYVIAISLLTLFLFMNAFRAWTWNTELGKNIEIATATSLLPQIWASPWLIIPMFIFALFVIPLGAAYWLTQNYQSTNPTALKRKFIEWNYPFLGLLVIIVTAIMGIASYFQAQFPWMPNSKVSLSFYLYIMMMGILTLVAYLLSVLHPPSAQTVVDSARNNLSRWLTTVFVFFVSFVILGIVDSLGQTSYAVVKSNKESVLITGLFSSIIVLIVKQFASSLSKDPQKVPKILRIPAQLLSLAVGLSLALIVATFWSAMAHAILWKGETPHGDPGSTIIAHYAPAKSTVSLNSESFIVVAPPSSNDEIIITSPEPPVEFVTAAFIITFIISLLTGKTISFLNLSSIQEFYASRLSRAYLGASNPRRTGFGADLFTEKNNSIKIKRSTNITKVVDYDDVCFTNYHPERNGGPIHLINVTINETVSGTSQIEQRDRKGLGMAIGPCGVSVGRTSHALWTGLSKDKLQAITNEKDDKSFNVFRVLPTNVESLSLGQWVAISGAAFSTGLGARTNLGMSLLFGLSNVRIGYWWDSGISPRSRSRGKTNDEGTKKITDWLEPLFSTQLYLSDEFFARFHGPYRQRWYLSDGGHYENTGVYELIRRRLPLIVLSDNGCDENYIFTDLANLIRKARIDFNAEIKMFNSDELDQRLGVNSTLRKFIGTPGELQKCAIDKNTCKGKELLKGQDFSCCHALLARVFYDCKHTPDSLLLIIKPSVIGTEPLDILEYRAEHPEFPQESTLDQFFDEAQWESYRKLGNHIGENIFNHITDIDKWVGTMLV